MSNRNAPAFGRPTAADLRFALTTLALILAAHAVAYLIHEYAHSFTAWALGRMADPLALDYGHATLDNLILLDQVDDNVPYDAIFATGHGYQAAAIALAGPFLGNGLLYVLLARAARCPGVAASRGLLPCVYWLALMCAGNVWSYVPIRALATHADIALAAKGLGISVWAQFPFLAALSAWITGHFFLRLFPRCQARIAGGSGNRLALMIATTAFWYFVFFGNAGLGGRYGTLAEVLSLLSECLLFPVAALFLAARYGPSRRVETAGAG